MNMADPAPALSRDGFSRNGHAAIPSGASRVYCFGDLRFDSMRRLLFRDSEVIPIPERMSLILTELLQANGGVVSKDTLALTVWPDEAVSDANLAQHIYMLRRLLGEHARDHAYILSVPRVGYRLAVPATVAPPALNESFTADAASLGEILSDAAFDPFRYYCQGSFFLEQRTAPSLRRATELFEAALKADPNYLPALIGVACAHAFLATYWHVPPTLSMPLAKKAVERALALDSTSAIAHAVRVEILCFCDWNWTEAHEENDLAIRLNPGSTFVRTIAAWLGVCTGRYQDALAHARLAVMMEPSSLPLRLLLARVLLHSREYSHAVAIMSNLLEADSTFYIARRYRAQAYLLSRDPAKARDDLEQLPQDRGEDLSFRLPMLGRAYAEMGDAARAASVFERLQATAENQYVACWNLAIVAVGLGRLERALEYLETAYERREPTLPFLKSLPWFEPLSENRRFQRLLQAIGPPS